jgi:hypothetical protein
MGKSISFDRRGKGFCRGGVKVYKRALEFYFNNRKPAYSCTLSTVANADNKIKTKRDGYPKSATHLSLLNVRPIILHANNHSKQVVI